MWPATEIQTDKHTTHYYYITKSKKETYHFQANKMLIPIWGGGGCFNTTYGVIINITTKFNTVNTLTYIGS